MKKKQYVIPSAKIVEVALPQILAGSDVYNTTTEYSAGGTDDTPATEDDIQL